MPDVLMLEPTSLAAAHANDDAMSDVAAAHTGAASSSNSSPAGGIARSLSIPIALSGGNGNKRSKLSSGSSSIASTTPPNSAMELMQQSHNTAAAAASTMPAGQVVSANRMSPGTYYRQAVTTKASNSSPQYSPQQQPMATPTSLQKRRNSNTPSLVLSPNQGPAASHVASALTAPPAAQLATNTPQSAGGSNTRGKPPAYPSTPGTPSMTGRTVPINVGSGSKSASQFGPTPPGTPQQDAALPRVMVPNSGMTPALAPERSITVSTTHGQVHIEVRSMSDHMDGVDEVVLPPQAAPDGKQSKTKSRSMASTAAVHTPKSAGPAVSGGQHHAGHHGSSSAASSTASPNSAPPHVTTVVPVKHLVKLSSLSSLSSLITPAPASPTVSGSPSPQSVGQSPTNAPSPVQLGDSPMSGRSMQSAATRLKAPTGLPPTLIILDIDETVHVNAYSPCEMMREKGLEMYQKIISSHANYRQVSYAAKSGLTKTLQAALQSKRTVESHTAELLNTLQASNYGVNGAPPANNIRIFGLTARFSHMAATTRKELLKLNIDLEKSSPFPMSIRKKIALQNGYIPGSCQAGQGGSPSHSPMTNDRSLTPSPVLTSASVPAGSSPGGGMSTLHLNGIKPTATGPVEEYWPDVSWTDHPSHGTDAKYSQGVIYSNACEKGPVLQRFLQFLWQKIEEDNAEIDAANEQVRRQFAERSAVGEDASMTGESHSMLSINHATSHPIQIVGAPSSAMKSSMSPAATPSPPDSSLSLLSAASRMANGARGSLKAPLSGGKRRDSQTSDHLLPPGAGTHSADPSSPMSTGSVSPHPSVGYGQVVHLQALSHLPTRIIFIDDRLQNCFSVYSSLDEKFIASFYNQHTSPPGSAASQHSRRHIPNALEIYTCHYQPPELTQHHGPTNQTKADAAASLAAQQARDDDGPDLELIETQIHHFLTHGEILNDMKGREMVLKIRAGQAYTTPGQIAQATAAAAAVTMATQQLHQAQVQAAQSTPSPSKPRTAAQVAPSTILMGAGMATASASPATASGDAMQTDSAGDQTMEATAIAVAEATPGGDTDVTMAVSTPRNVPIASH